MLQKKYSLECLTAIFRLAAPHSRYDLNASSENAINIQFVTVPLQKVRKHLCLHGEVGDVQKFSEREGVRLFGVCAVKQRNTVFSKLFLKYHQSRR